MIRFSFTTFNYVRSEGMPLSEASTTKLTLYRLNFSMNDLMLFQMLPCTKSFWAFITQEWLVACMRNVMLLALKFSAERFATNTKMRKAKTLHKRVIIIYLDAYSHINLPCSCIILCAIKSAFSLNPLPQIGHKNGQLSLCLTFICLLHSKEHLQIEIETNNGLILLNNPYLNFFPQILHVYGVSPV